MHVIDNAGLYNYLVERKVAGLKENTKLITLKKGQQLYGTSQNFTDIFEVISGAIKLGGISAKGDEYIYEIVTPGEFFGNLALLGDTFSEFCKTMTAAQFHSYKAPFFKHLMTHDPE